MRKFSEETRKKMSERRNDFLNTEKGLIKANEICCEYKSIQGFSRYIATIDGRIFYKVNEDTYRIKKYSTNKNSYQMICLVGDDKTGKLDYVHRIIAKTWCENLNDKNEVDHIDNNRLNQHASNLRWVSHGENMQNLIKRKNKLLALT